MYKNSPYLTLDGNVTDSTEFMRNLLIRMKLINLLVNLLVNKNENYEIAYGENETVTKTSDTVTLKEFPSKKIK